MFNDKGKKNLRFEQFKNPNDGSSSEKFRPK